MTISKTPLRIVIRGGGTEFLAFDSRHGANYILVVFKYV